MEKHIGLVLVIALLSVALARFLDSGAVEQVVAANNSDIAENDDARPVPQRTGGAHRLILRAERDGHYYAKAELNGTRIRMLIDTGATIVALRESDARKAGLYVIDVDFDYPLATANGDVLAAQREVRNLELGPLRLYDQDVFILPDDKLGISLLGMSVLSNAGRVEIADGRLTIEDQR